MTLGHSKLFLGKYSSDSKYISDEILSADETALQNIHTPPPSEAPQKRINPMNDVMKISVATPPGSVTPDKRKTGSDTDVDSYASDGSQRTRLGLKSRLEYIDEDGKFLCLLPPGISEN